MRRIRVIPTLLIQNGGLVKTVRFKKPTYVGDPINAVKIFNDKEVDEIVILDISAARDRTPPNLQMISDIAGEAFMPLGYGGGITTTDEIQTILRAGAEKVVLNTSALENPGLIAEAARRFGSQSVVVSIDVKRKLGGRYEVLTRGGAKRTGRDPVTVAREVEGLGAGEIFLTSIDREGTYEGYDLNLIEEVSRAVSVPVIACGGAASVDNLAAAVRAGASAAAAGSMFVFHGPHRAVLINYPPPKVLKELLTS
jgi:imidazole glycerol-phosphate synthase subunit HisF